MIIAICCAPSLRFAETRVWVPIDQAKLIAWLSYKTPLAFTVLRSYTAADQIGYVRITFFFASRKVLSSWLLVVIVIVVGFTSSTIIILECIVIVFDVLSLQHPQERQSQHPPAAAATGVSANSSAPSRCFFGSDAVFFWRSRWRFSNRNGSGTNGRHISDRRFWSCQDRKTLPHSSSTDVRLVQVQVWPLRHSPSKFNAPIMTPRLVKAKSALRVSKINVNRVGNMVRLAIFINFAP